MKNMISVLMLILGLASTTAIYAEEISGNPDVKPLDFSMVISGGVSLGAYESGYNWACLLYTSPSPRDS